MYNAGGALTESMALPCEILKASVNVLGLGIPGRINSSLFYLLKRYKDKNKKKDNRECVSNRRMINNGKTK